MIHLVRTLAACDVLPGGGIESSCRPFWILISAPIGRVSATQLIKISPARPNRAVLIAGGASKVTARYGCNTNISDIRSTRESLRLCVSLLPTTNKYDRANHGPFGFLFWSDSGYNIQPIDRSSSCASASGAHRGRSVHHLVAPGLK